MTQPRRIGPFRVERPVGAGASGVVYEVVSEHGDRLALKSLIRARPRDVYQLKREFRALSDASHPNLIRMYELGESEGDWYFTMDLIEGAEFHEYVWGDVEYEPFGSSWDPEAPDSEIAEHAPPPIDYDRLRSALSGVAAGLSALHARALLHRDIKPSNVMVHPDGTARVLDFGLVVAVDAVSDERVSGTVAYMSPEQAQGLALTPASDWYAFGAMLYEAISGRPPLVGTMASVLVGKVVTVPMPLAELVPEAPADLTKLADELLRIDPRQRPTGQQVCGLLGADWVPVPEPVPFVGRVGELAALERALESSRESGRVVALRGQSGMGKSRLVEEFVAQRPELLVLRARCYERERGPFKAIDPLVEALTEELVSWPYLEQEKLLTPALSRLVVMFPSLARLTGAARDVPQDAVSLRIEAADCLRSLLFAVAKTRQVVVIIDDLQWADGDSMAVLSALLAPPGPPLLVLLLMREEDQRGSQWARALSVPLETVALTPLDDELSLALVRQILGNVGAIEDRLLAESGGSPFFLKMLAQWLGSDDSQDLVDGDGLIEQIVSRRVEQLSELEVHLLSAVAVAGRPLIPSVAIRASQSGDRAWLKLIKEGLLTSIHGGFVQCTHDRIREVLCSALPASRVQQLHGDLARSCLPDTEPSHVATHWEEAGEVELAVEWYGRAAEHAMGRMAFEQAAEWFERIESLSGSTDAAISAGGAWAKAGKGTRAAKKLLSVVDQVGEPRSFELEAEAAHLLLRAGHYSDALPLLPDVVARVGLRWPASSTRALADLVWYSIRNRYLPVLGKPNPEALRLALDLSMSLAYPDMLRSGVFGAQASRLAEASGDPYQIAYSYALRASNAALTGEQAFGEQLIATARERCPASADPLQKASIQLQSAIVDCAAGRMESGLGSLQHSAAAFAAAGGRPYELEMANLFLGFCLMQLCRFEAFRAFRRDQLRLAIDRGNAVMEVLFRVSFTTQPGLLDDDVEAAIANLEAAGRRWTSDGLTTPWLYLELSWAQLELYQGQALQAWERVREVERRCKGAPLLRLPLNHNLLHTIWAAAAAATGNVADLTRCAAAHRGCGDALSLVQAHLSDAQMHGVSGRVQEALAALDAAEEWIRQGTQILWVQQLLLPGWREQLEGKPLDASRFAAAGIVDGEAWLRTYGSVLPAVRD